MRGGFLEENLTKLLLTPELLRLLIGLISFENRIKTSFFSALAYSNCIDSVG
jgi:hypothetical protein